MNGEGSSQALAYREKQDFTLMDKGELEALTVAAIHRHRCLLTSDQAVYEEWLRVSEDPSTPGSVQRALQEEHTMRQTRAAAQQDELSDMLDALGFVPEVPSDDEAS